MNMFIYKSSEQYLYFMSQNKHLIVWNLLIEKCAYDVYIGYIINTAF